MQLHQFYIFINIIAYLNILFILNIYGGYIIIQHDNGTFTAYAHMSDTKVYQGQKVYKGEKIGVIGNTGILTGTHLHFEVILTPHKFISLTS